jgi:hypothetical protein
MKNRKFSDKKNRIKIILVFYGFAWCKCSYPKIFYYFWKTTQQNSFEILEERKLIHVVSISREFVIDFFKNKDWKWQKKKTNVREVGPPKWRWQLQTFTGILQLICYNLLCCFQNLHIYDFFVNPYFLFGEPTSQPSNFKLVIRNIHRNFAINLL